MTPQTLHHQKRRLPVRLVEEKLAGGRYALRDRSEGPLVMDIWTLKIREIAHATSD